MLDWLHHILKAKGIHLAELRDAHSSGYNLGFYRGAVYGRKQRWVRDGDERAVSLRQAEHILEAKNYNG